MKANVISEGTAAYGIFDKDSTVAKTTISKLKARLKHPMPAIDGKTEMYSFVYDDDLHDMIDEIAYENPDTDITKDTAVMRRVNQLLASAEKNLPSNMRESIFEKAIREKLTVRAERKLNELTRKTFKGILKEAQTNKAYLDQSGETSGQRSMIDQMKDQASFVPYPMDPEDTEDGDLDGVVAPLGAIDPADMDEWDNEDASIFGEAAEDEKDWSDKETDKDVKEDLGPNAKAGDYVDDFVNSKNKKFDGDSKEQRIKRALGAYYGQNEAKIQRGSVLEKIINSVSETIKDGGKPKKKASKF